MIKIFLKTAFYNFIAVGNVIVLNYLVTGSPQVADEISLLVGLFVGMGVYFTYTKPQLDKLRMERKDG